jgi:hypothetical protein
MEELSSYKTSDLTRTTRRNIPEGAILLVLTLNLYLTSSSLKVEVIIIPKHLTTFNEMHCVIYQKRIPFITVAAGS